GASKNTVKRYRPVFDKFLPFAGRHGIQYWQQVTNNVVARYGKWLEDEEYAYATQYLELNTLKQAAKWLVGQGLLPTTCLITLTLRKPQGTTTYCYTPEQFQAIVQFCRRQSELGWLADVVTALGTTGLRIG